MKNKKTTLSLAIAAGLFMMASAQAGDIENNLPDTGSNLTVKQGTTELMRVMGDGKVGIGTAAPTAKFAVEDNNLAAGKGLAMYLQTDQTNKNVAFRIGAGTKAYGYVGSFAESYAHASPAFANSFYKANTVALFTSILTDGLSIASPRTGTGFINFYTGGDKDTDINMTIRGDGNVGIGTTAPSSKLAVVGLPSGASATAAGANGNLAGAVCITDTGDMYIDTDGSCVGN